jgi:AraC-like DNA-binding protein/ligand-binding sensor protein
MSQVTDVFNDAVQPKDISIINQREIEPILVEARRIITFYEQASGCAVSVQDQNGYSVSTPGDSKDLYFCEFCRRYTPNSQGKWKADEYPCTDMHLDALRESRRRRSSYIYACRMGFIYWTSPLYAGSRYAGALLAGQVLTIGHAQAAERFFSWCRGTIPLEDIQDFLADVPEKSHEEIMSLARLLQICADKISANSADSREAAKQFSRQESNMNIQINRIKTRMMKNNAQEDKSNPAYPLDRERMLFATLRRGDLEAGRKILDELLEIILMTSPGNLEYIRFRAIELVVLLSRSAAEPTHSDGDAILDTNNRYIRRILDSRSIEELTENLYGIIDRMSSQFFSFQGVRHASALRKAERFVWENYTRKISLQEIANASGLSAPYFSTIFKEEMGENLSTYLNHLRVEKAEVMLAGSSLSLSEIADACGFEDQSWFSKIFKSFTRMSPGKYREQGGGALPLRYSRVKNKNRNDDEK